MPAMDGATLIDRIRGLDPNMKFIAISGLLEEPASGGAGHSAFGVRILQKPFSAEALLRATHDALQTGPGNGRGKT
jgi:CheY-like chemotaxis protein